jgi:hypothetical protein|tara:strand:- start:3890 stop:4159 length:270 start_codon:yes stop_codon:yes gene_type:complete
MAFTSSTFSLVSYSGNGFHIWHYKSDDAATAIDAAGYFNTYAKEINAGDVIFATTAASGTPVYGQFVVSSNDGTTVDVNNISAATSDSD